MLELSLFSAASGPRRRGLSVLLGALLIGSLACDSQAAEPAQEEGAAKPESDDADNATAEHDPDAQSPTAPRVDAGRAAAGPGKVDAGSKPPSASDAGATQAASDDAGSSDKGDAGNAGAKDDAAAAKSDAGAPAPSGTDDTTIAMTIPPASNGAGEVRPSTTVVKNEKNGGKDVWDFENKKIGVNNTADCDNGEGQMTVFEVDDGVTLKNLIIAGGKPGGNGIVCKGSCTLDHVYWEDVCEDAATNSKDGATMTLDHVIALHASDKVFQHNAKAGAKTVIKNSYISDFGKLWRSCGDCEANGGPRHLVIDNVRVEGIKVTVAGANQNYGDSVTVHNLYVKGGYDAAKDKPKICEEFIGVTDHNGESTKVDNGASKWNTATCKLSMSDVKSY